LNLHPTPALHTPYRYPDMVFFLIPLALPVLLGVAVYKGTKEAKLRRQRRRLAKAEAAAGGRTGGAVGEAGSGRFAGKSGHGEVYYSQESVKAGSGEALPVYRQRVEAEMGLPAYSAAVVA